MNAIITVEERVSNFSSPSFPWNAMLRALVQVGHLDLKGIGTSGFDWGIYSFCDNEDQRALFDSRVLQSQVLSLADHGIIWIERETVRRDDYMATNLCPLATQSGANCNAISLVFMGNHIIVLFIFSALRDMIFFYLK